MIDFESRENQLILNPRLPQETSSCFTQGWNSLVVGRWDSQIGLATSGSSGDAMGKIIVLSKAALLAAAAAANDRVQATAQDVWLKALPDFHVGGLGILARSHLSGAKVVDVSRSKWDPVQFVSDLSVHNVSLASLVPTQVFDLVQARLSAPGRLRAVIVGGGRLESELRSRALELGWPLLVSYGLTECCSQVATARSPRDSGLIPLSHVEVRINAQERIELRSPALLTARIVFRRQGPSQSDVEMVLEDPKQNGWFTTDDRGRIESDGALVILGREQDFVKVGGEGVLVSRLEEKFEALRLSLRPNSNSDSGAHPLSQDSRGADVFGRSDSVLLAAQDARLGAVIVLITTASAEEIEPLVRGFNAEVAPFERIRSVYCVVEIPRSALGKVLRREALALVGLVPPS